MKTLRQLHLYLGCIFAPLILYFSLSGAWQMFRLNDIPKDAPPSPARALFHALSNPHTHSTLPGLNPKTESSSAFNWIAAAMALGMVVTTCIGLMLAFRYSRSTRILAACVCAGLAVPILLLFLR